MRLVPVGLVLSAVVIAVAVWFTRGDDDNESGLQIDWIYDFITFVITGIALLFIWLAVLMAVLANKRDANRRSREVP
jgi:hypothetical protein